VSPFGSFFVALRLGCWYPVAVAFTALLAELNNILLPTVLFSVAYNDLVYAVYAFMLIIWCWACWRT
jgi:hypothetical protein